jgi:hypothetical protein
MSDFGKAMAACTWNEITDILLACSAADRNGRMAQRLYQERFPNRRLPHHSTFASINQRLRETGLLHVNRHDYGQGRTARTPRFEEAVLNMVADTPSSSTRRNGQAMHASYTTVRQVVHQQQLHQYHQQKVQAMGPVDYPK